MRPYERIVFGFLHLLSLLPLRVLYVLSDCAFPVVYYIVRYRRRLVARQLAESFPEKSIAERNRIARRCYRMLCDYVAETLKMQSLSPEEMRRRVRFIGMDTLQDEMHRRGKSLSFAYLGHYGNWEWLSSFSLWVQPGTQAAQIYHPLRNRTMDDFYLRPRSRYGGKNIPMKETLRQILSMRQSCKELMVGSIADQCPKWEAMHQWTQFLGHDTSFYIGTERLAKKLDAVLFYVHVTRPRRGYYDCRIVPMCWDAKEVPDFTLTDRYAAMLEEQIRETPELWLWTHNRWKRTKAEWERRRATTPTPVLPEGRE